MYGDNRVILARTSISIDDNINIGNSYTYSRVRFIYINIFEKERRKQPQEKGTHRYRSPTRRSVPEKCLKADWSRSESPSPVSATSLFTSKTFNCRYILQEFNFGDLLS